MYLGYREISFSERLCYNLLRGEKMKIKTEQDLSCNEIEVIIKYPQKNKQVHRIIDFLQSFDMQIKCAGDNAEQIINILDIYYIESVDKKTFVYLENTVFFVAFNSLQHNKSTRRNLKISKKTDNISCFSIDSFL